MVWVVGRFLKSMQLKKKKSKNFLNKPCSLQKAKFQIKLNCIQFIFYFLKLGCFLLF